MTQKQLRELHKGKYGKLLQDHLAISSFGWGQDSFFNSAVLISTSTVFTNLINLQREKWVLKINWSLPAESSLICGHLGQPQRLKRCCALPRPVTKEQFVITTNALWRHLDVQSSCHIAEKHKEQTSLVHTFLSLPLLLWLCFSSLLWNGFSYALLPLRETQASSPLTIHLLTHRAQA